MPPTPDGRPGRAGRMMFAMIVGVVLALLVVVVFAYREAPPTPERGRSTMPGQAAEGAGAAGSPPR